MYQQRTSNKDRKLEDYEQAQNSNKHFVIDNEVESQGNFLAFSQCLPFHYQEEDPLLLSPFELLIGGYASELHPSDGFLDFHHLKYVTTNAKQLSKWFQMTMGFTEIAFKGLETGSVVLASHVIKNGNIVIELISTIESVAVNPTKFPFLLTKDIKERSTSNSNKGMDAVELIAKLNQVVDSLVSENLINETAKDWIFDRIYHSRDFEKFKSDLSEIWNDLSSVSINSAYDLMDSFLIANYLNFHGEGVMDVALSVDDVDKVYYKAIKSGGVIIKEPQVLKDQYGEIKTATIGIPGTDIRHTLIENVNYSGCFLPGYVENDTDPTIQGYPCNTLVLDRIDHCVENYSWHQMDAQAKLYAEMFGFHKFWSVDDTIINTGKSSLNSTVMSSANGRIKIPINEPSDSKYKGQIEEFNDFNGGPGVQHIALKTFDIINTVISMKQRGIKFNELTPKYYQNLENRLANDDIELLEEFSTLKELNILVDYDSSTRNPKTKRCNYLLQIFTNPLTDRPTLFLEIIQRHNHNGFGKGTFKGLYESIELDQIKRGTLVKK